MKASLTQSKAYLIDFGASNHMVASNESFTTLTRSRGLSIHMGDDSQILAVERGSIKILHHEFKNVLYVPSPVANQIVQDEEEPECSTQSIRIEESLLGVTHSTPALKVYEISHISYSHMNYLEEDI